MKELFDRVKGRGIAAVRLAPRPDVASPGAFAGWGPLHMEIFDEAVSLSKKGSPLVVKDIDMLLKRLLTGRKGRSCSGGPGSTGGRRISMDWKGDLIPCTMGEKGSRHILSGNQCGVDKNMAESPGTDSPLRCRQCRWRNFCPSRSPAEKESIPAGEIDPRCGLYRYLFEELCWSLDRNPGIPKMLS